MVEADVKEEGGELLAELVEAQLGELDGTVVHLVHAYLQRVETRISANLVLCESNSSDELLISKFVDLKATSPF